ncbi:hypothetical protein ACFL1Z_03755 [Thermodesulfobacteriota bacterium]
METELIQCIGLPGKRLISRYICGRRYVLALKRAKMSAKPGLDIAHMSSLDICCTCVEGKTNAKSFKNELLNKKI